MIRKSSIVLVLAVTIAGFITSQRSEAADFPTRLIHFIIPLAPGGNTDVTARLLAQDLSQQFGQNVIVENKPGGETIIASDYVAKSLPDGYTLLFQSTELTFLKPLHKDLPFDLQKDFIPVYQYVKFPFMLFASNRLPVNSVRELIDYAKKNPGKLNYGNSGAYSGPDLAMHLFESIAGISFQSVPYKGGAESTTAAIRGEVDVLASAPFPAMNYVQSGQLKALAVLQGERSALLPEISGMREQGVNGVEAAYWNGVFAPAGTPPEIVDKINHALSTALRRPEMAAKFRAMGVEAVPQSDPAEFRKIIAAETTKWGKVIKSLGVAPQ